MFFPAIAPNSSGLGSVSEPRWKALERRTGPLIRAMVKEASRCRDSISLRRDVIQATKRIQGHSLFLPTSSVEHNLLLIRHGIRCQKLLDESGCVGSVTCKYDIAVNSADQGEEGGRLLSTCQQTRSCAYDRLEAACFGRDDHLCSRIQQLRQSM